MSLSDAVLAVAAAMERDCVEMTDPTVGEKVFLAMMRGYARELRTAVKAAEGQTVWERKPSPAFLEEMRKQTESVARATQAQEQGGTEMALCENGPADGTFAPTTGMPEGAYVKLEGAVYQLRQGKLIYNAEQTAKLASPR